MNRALTSVVSVLCLLGAGTGLAGVIHVPTDYTEIYDAVQACAAGDTVQVAAGTYNDCTHETEGPGSTTACVIMKSGVTLRGAGQDATIIDAQQLGRGIFVELVDNCRIENLQVRGAFAEVYGAGILIRHVDNTVSVTDVKVTLNGDGGIICVYDAAPVLTRVQFLDNIGKYGGGLAVESGSDVYVRDCIVDGNSASGSGAGIYVLEGSAATIQGCTVTDNEITALFAFGGGIAAEASDVTIFDCTVSNNRTQGFGGGLGFTNGVTGEVYDCWVEGNEAIESYNEGGGIYASQSTITLHNVVFVGNLASGPFAEGGGVAASFPPSPTFEKCTFVGNGCSVQSTAGTIYTAYGATPAFTNCIIVSSPQGAAVVCSGADPVFTGCDVWDNAGGNALCGTDNGCNFSANPMFCGLPGFEYHIEPGSPCGAGNHPTVDCGTTYCGAYPAGCSDVAVEETPAAGRVVLGNTPNPFNPTTTIHFVLDYPGNAVVRIFDLRGHGIRTYRFRDVAAGQRHEFTWNGKDHAGLTMPSGVYVYQLEAGGRTTSKRMSLIR